MQHFKNASVKLSPTQTFPQCRKKNFHCKSNTRHFCWCHCSCYHHYCPSLIAFLQLPTVKISQHGLPPPQSNNHNNTNHCKRVITQAEMQIWGRPFTLSYPINLPNNLHKYCTRALNHSLTEIISVQSAIRLSAIYSRTFG